MYSSNLVGLYLAPTTTTSVDRDPARGLRGTFDPTPTPLRPHPPESMQYPGQVAGGRTCNHTPVPGRAQQAATPPEVRRA